MRTVLPLVAVVTLALSACDDYQPRYQPWPEQMELKVIDGPTLDRASLSGRSSVINVWRPG